MYKPKPQQNELAPPASASVSDSIPIFFERMEPKILLSADALSGLVSGDPFSDDVSNAALDIVESAHLLNTSYASLPDNTDSDFSDAADESQKFDLLTGFIGGNVTSSDTGLSIESIGALLNETDNGIDNTTDSRQEIIFVDAATPDYQQLLNGIKTDTPGTEYQIFILQSDRDGIEQVTEILGSFQDVDGVHLIGHGDEQGIQLGASWLSGESLPEYETLIGVWSDALQDDADLLIYGCNLAAGADGQQLISSLVELTGADVAASDDLTGALSLGGDWQLEYTTGDIESTVAFSTSAQQSWSNVLGTINVTTFNDVVDGDADLTSLANLALTPGSDGFVSLREAIIAANTDTVSGLDEIVLSAGTYDLTLSGLDNTAILGDLDITDALSLKGDSAATTIINGNASIESVFEIRDTGVEISDLTMANTGGLVLQGGGVYVAPIGGVTLTDVTISNNQGSEGGGLYNAGGTAALNRVLFSGNTSVGDGGAIYNENGSVITGTDVEFDSNTALGNGGAIYNNASITLDRALFYDNTAAFGGAIYNEGIAGNVIKLTNATLSANTATIDGGAINNIASPSSVPGTLTITNSTLTGNTSPGTNGILQDAASVVNLKNSILNDGVSNITGGIINSLDYNIDSDGSAGLTGLNDQVGNPMLDVLADNGGFTRTHALLAGSVAINPAGLAGAPLVDQRGISRDLTPDIGAFEVRTPVLVNNSLTLSQGETVVIDASNFSATVDGSITFTVSAVSNGHFAFIANTAIAVPGFTQSDITAGIVRFVHDGGELAPGYAVTVSDGTTTTVAASASISFTGTSDGVLWLSIDGNEGAGSGIPGLDTTDIMDDDVLQQAGPNFSMGEAATDGTFSMAFNPSDFSAGENINGMHYVTSSITIGSGINAIALQAGDLILTTTNGETFISNGAGAPADLLVDRQDIFFFRPDTAGDYNTGNFYMLLSDPFLDGKDITAITLLEKDVFVGDTWLITGDLLLVRDDAAVNNIELLKTDTLDPLDGLTYPVTQVLIEGDDAGVDLDKKIYGIDVLEQDTVVGGIAYDAGTILLTFDADDDDGVGSNGQLVDMEDIVALSVTNTTLGSGAGSALATASLMFDGNDVSGNDVNFDSPNEKFDGFTLTHDVISANIAPVLSNNDLVIIEGATVTVTSAMLSATDADSAENGLAFNVSGVTGGQFELTSNPGVAVSSFYQGQVLSSEVVFVDNGDENAPTFDVSVTDGSDPSPVVAGGVTFSNTNDIPVLVNNDLVVAEGQTVTVTGTMLSASDVETAAGTLIFNVSSVVGGQFELSSAPTVAVTSFTQAQVLANDVVFVDNGDENAPTFDVSVTDGSDPSPVVAGGVTFSNTNDIPVLVNNDLVVAEGQTVTVTATMLSASDVETAAGTLIFNVSSVVGGQFELSSAPTVAVTSFTQAQVLANDVVFVDNGDENAPTFDVSVTDGSDPSPVVAGGVTFSNTNDIPVLVNNDLVVAEGQTVTVTATMLSASDVETAAGTLIFNVSSVVGGQFELTSAPTVAVTSFTQAQVLANDVVFVDNGDENAPTFDVSVTDGSDPSPVVAGGVTFSTINDAPTATGLSSTSFYNEGDAVVAITDIAVTDVDIAEVITATLTLADITTGSLSANDGATYTAATGVWTITDSLVNVNTALANLVFNPATNNDLNTTISVNIDDGDEDSSGALTGTINLNVTVVNDAPTATNLTSIATYIEGDTGVVITDIVVADVDTAEAITATLTLADTTTGSLSANDGAAYNAATGVWSITNSVANVNAALANLVFNPTTGNDLNTSISVLIDDGDEDSSGPLSGTIALNVTAVNNAPSAINLEVGNNYNEGDAPVALHDIVIADLDSGETVTATLTLSNVDAGTLSANDGASYDAVTGVWTITGTVANVNTALANLSFTPDASNALSTSISVSIDDGDEDSSGPLLGEFSITVNPNLVALAAVESEDSPASLDDATIVETASIETDPEPETVEQDIALGAVASESASDADSYIITKGGKDVVNLSVSTTQEANLSAHVNDNIKGETSAQQQQFETGIVRLREQLTAFKDPLQLISAESFFSKLNNMREELVLANENTEKIVGGSLTVSAGISVGYVVWLARSGILMSSLLSSLPAWRFIDPLPVLASFQHEELEEDEESLESMVEDQQPNE